MLRHGKTSFSNNYYPSSSENIVERVKGFINIAEKLFAFSMDKNSLFKFLKIRNSIKN